MTPVEQALRYVHALPPSVKPSVICTCNFETFRFYDLEEDPLAKGKPVEEFTLQELPERIKVLQRIFGEKHSRLMIEQQLSETAGLMVARLHNELAKQYRDPDEPKAHHALSILTVRLVFCLYAEDAGLFDHDLFSEYVCASSPERLRRDLVDLFEVLNTSFEERDPYLEKPLSQFPYVNGGLFAEKVEVPPMTEEIQSVIGSAGVNFDWSDISPVIFGSLMEETLSHDQRRGGGMHYTTVENIHRLIDPLFLDDLKTELDDIETDPKLGERARANHLQKFQDKLASLRFLDPACGSGNFLTETFLQLRELENRAIAGILHGQGYIEFGDGSGLVKVKIDQFHGIEINDFAVCVARTALWIAEQQALDDTEIIAGQSLPHLPLHDSGNIVCANALRYDWNESLPGMECDYVMGNPPFIGQYTKTSSQADDMKLVWGDDWDGYLDYATGWYRKAADYLALNPHAAFAFVSTNSITQGQPVPALFKPLVRDGWRIMFAHRTFAWNAQSTDTAHVHVVIIGFDRRKDSARRPRLFRYEDIQGAPIEQDAIHLNGYLIDGPEIYVEKRSQKAGPLSAQLSPANRGSQPTDGGHLLLDTIEDRDEALRDPIAAQYVRPFRMGRELINNIPRWCLWLVDAAPSDIRRSPFLSRRVQQVKEVRLASKKVVTREKAKTPWLFDENHQPSGSYLAIPAVFSGRREYATCDWYAPDTIAGNKIYTSNDPDGFSFAIIESGMFIAWQKGIGGRLKSDCNFSNTVVWNTLPLPQVDDELRGKIIEAGQHILAVRGSHEGQSLADLYDPDLMPVDLRKAHEELDKLVDRAFGAPKWLKQDEDARLQLLLRNYLKMTKGR